MFSSASEHDSDKAAHNVILDQREVINLSSVEDNLRLAKQNRHHNKRSLMAFDGSGGESSRKRHIRKESMESSAHGSWMNVNLSSGGAKSASDRELRLRDNLCRVPLAGG